MSKRTPGPWRIRRHGYESPYMAHCFIEDASGTPICAQWWPNGDADSAANARLISAAPDLLEVCRSIENDDGSIPAAIWNLRNAAIAKVEGK